MKKIFSIVVLFFLGTLTINAQEWKWVTQGGGHTDLIVQEKGITVDKDDHIITTGWYSDSVTFGERTLTGGGLYITKHDTSGELSWVVSEGEGTGDVSVFSGSSNLIPYGIAHDKANNIYIIGSNDASSMIGGELLSKEGFFLAKFDEDGTFLWNKKGEGNVENMKLASDSDGNITIAVDYKGVIVFDSEIVTSLDQWSNSTLFRRYNTDGELSWSNELVALGSQTGVSDLLINNNGDIICSVYSGGDSLMINNMTILYRPSAGFLISYMLKLNAEGKLVWIKDFFNQLHI